MNKYLYIIDFFFKSNNEHEDHNVCFKVGTRVNRIFKSDYFVRYLKLYFSSDIQHFND